MNDIVARHLNAHVWDRAASDYYIEPEWVDEAIFHQEQFIGAIHDPSCGSGRIVRAARAAGYEATGADLVQRCEECRVVGNFLHSTEEHDNIVCNPPFGIADQFVKHALHLARRKVVMILPARFTSGEKRSLWLEYETPLRRNLDIVPRPSMPPGELIERGEKPGGGKIDFKLLVWQINYDGKPEGGWLRRVASRASREAA